VDGENERISATSPSPASADDQVTNLSKNLDSGTSPKHSLRERRLRRRVTPSNRRVSLEESDDEDEHPGNRDDSNSFEPSGFDGMLPTRKSRDANLGLEEAVDSEDSNSFVPSVLDGMSSSRIPRVGGIKRNEDEADRDNADNFEQFVASIRDCGRRSLRLLNEIRSIDDLNDLPSFVRRSREIASWYNEIVFLAEQSLGDFDKIPEESYLLFLNENKIASNAISAIQSDLDLVLSASADEKRRRTSRSHPIIPPQDSTSSSGVMFPPGRKYMSINVPGASPPRFDLSPDSCDDLVEHVRNLKTTQKRKAPQPAPVWTPAPFPNVSNFEEEPVAKEGAAPAYAWLSKPSLEGRSSRSRSPSFGMKRTGVSEKKMKLPWKCPPTYRLLPCPLPAQSRTR